jgi:hypothetical protein
VTSIRAEAMLFLGLLAVPLITCAIPADAVAAVATAYLGMVGMRVQKLNRVNRRRCTAHHLTAQRRT